MTVGIDIVDGYGLSNEAHCKFLPKKRGNAAFTVYFTVVKGH